MNMKTATSRIYENYGVRLQRKKKEQQGTKNLG